MNKARDKVEVVRFLYFLLQKEHHGRIVIGDKSGQHGRTGMLRMGNLVFG